jgi:hypothetical protein
MLRDEPQETSAVRAVDADEFVEQKCRRSGEIGFADGVETAQFGVSLNWRTTSW